MHSSELPWFELRVDWADVFAPQGLTVLGFCPVLQKMNGRFFAGRTVAAYPLVGKNKFKKSGTELSLAGTGLGDADEDAAALESEKERLDKYADWLEKGGE